MNAEKEADFIHKEDSGILFQREITLLGHISRAGPARFLGSQIRQLWDSVRRFSFFWNMLGQNWTPKKTLCKNTKSAFLRRTTKGSS